MAAPTISELREGLKANLAALDGVQVSAYTLTNPTPPAIEVQLGETEFDHAMGRGLDEHTFTVRAYASRISDLGAQMKLDELRAPGGATSVKAALETDKTLGGKAQTLRVLRAGPETVYRLDSGGDLLGCEWTVGVLARGT